MIGDFWKVRFAHTLNTQVAFNVWHFVTAAETGAGVTPQKVADQMDSLWGPAIKPLMTNAANYKGCGVQLIRGGVAFEEVYAALESGIGTGGTNPLPQQVAGLVKLMTGIAGRANRGRKFIPFPDESMNSGADIQGPTAGYLLNVSNLMSNFIPFVVAGGAGDTTTLEPTTRTREGVSYPRVTLYNVRAYWSQQRRRSLLQGPDAVFPPA